ncbi:GH1 family beta-glucosidase [Lacimicrobium sp. SS2-24]|uniref:GH1 family beta-glucosidase n=1 Tax=Lacimicrobium sp. SS2-24 TaxID=2005569 RepID=UPI001FEE1F35|nr:GH1 family beta-glucosidase [Lacimicrobium sp. SS2-24]
MKNKSISLPSASPLLRQDFTFGVATASFQIEGAAQSRLETIWDRFCDTPGKIRDGSDGKTACEHLLHWEADLRLIRSLGVDAYRFSVSWARVMHEDGSVNQQGLDFYIALLDRLNEYAIKPFVTLYHWDLPQYLEDQGGWLNRDTAYRFRDYADCVSKAFGDRVHSYATLNEPFCSAYLGYEAGIHAPGHKSRAYGKQAAHHLLLAHGLAMEVLERNAPDALNGIVLNFSPCYAASDSAEDGEAAKLADEYFNHWYLQPLLEKRYPDVLHKLPEHEHPPIQPGDMEIIGHRLDYIGINYYTRERYQESAGELFEKLEHDQHPLTDMGWEVYPQGLTDLLVDYHQRYQLPPIFITENGAAMVDKVVDGKVDDPERLDYLQSHLLAVHKACEQGVDVRGYFAWSLMDNFEWAEGYLKRFGIVYVDYDSQQRIIKSSGYAYRDFLLKKAQSSGSQHETGAR